MAGRVDGWLDKLDDEMDGWMGDGWMDNWLAADWLDGWLNEWMVT